MSRDLLYKPAVPFVLPDETEDGKKAGTNRSVDKLGLKNRGRDIGGTAADPAKARGPAVPATGAPSPAAEPASSQRTRGPAFQAAYFNKDVGSTQTVNQRAKPMQALRGGEGATDLKKIVLPPPQGSETPEPAQLRSAVDLMGLEGGFAPDLGGLLQRQGGWLKGKNVTVEMIKARLEQLEQMVRDRMTALQRMANLPQDRVGRSVTLDQATQAQGTALEGLDDLAGEGAGLVRNTANQAQGLHKRIAKVLGIKTPS